MQIYNKLKGMVLKKTCFECEKKTCLVLFMMFYSHVTNFATCLRHFYLVFGEEIFCKGV